MFVVSSSGGKPKQLTFNTAADSVVGWTPDSKRVLFSTPRGTVFPGVAVLYEVSIDGGLETALPTDWGGFGSYSPDGARLVFNRHYPSWWRKHYRGSYAADIWLLDVKGKELQETG